MTLRGGFDIEGGCDLLLHVQLHLWTCVRAQSGHESPPKCQRLKMDLRSDGWDLG